MSRRPSFRLELGGFFQETRSLEFESRLVIQISGVSPEFDETAVPSAEAPGKAAQSALTAGPLALEQATIHAVAEALQSRGSAPAGDLTEEMPRESPCDNAQTKCVEEPSHGGDLALL